MIKSDSTAKLIKYITALFDITVKAKANIKQGILYFTFNLWMGELIFM